MTLPRMITLLRSFRLDISDVIVMAGIEKRPHAKRYLNRLCSFIVTAHKIILNQFNSKGFVCFKKCVYLKKKLITTSLHQKFKDHCVINITIEWSRWIHQPSEMQCRHDQQHFSASAPQSKGGRDMDTPLELV